MNRRNAIVTVAIAAAATTLALTAPLPVAGAIGITALALRRHGRLGFLGVAALTIALNILLFGFLIWTGPGVQLGPVSFYPQAAAVGAAAGLRLAAAVGANFAVFDRAPATVVLDGLRLPARLTGFLAAIVLGAHAVSEDARRLALAQRLEMGPGGLRAKLRGVARLLPPLLLSGLRRAQIRKDALRLAGHDTGNAFAPVVAIAALAIAGRLAFAAIPNVSPVYVIVFLGGVLFGPWVGAWAGAVSMALSNVLLSGLFLPAYANVPAMALLGVLGGFMRGLDWTGRGRAHLWANRLLCGATGYAAVLLFSLASDGFTWLIVAEYRDTPGTLLPLVVAGLVFNLIPAAANAILFALATPAAVRAWRLFAMTPSGTSRYGPQPPGQRDALR